MGTAARVGEAKRITIVRRASGHRDGGPSGEMRDQLVSSRFSVAIVEVGQHMFESIAGNEPELVILDHAGRGFDVVRVCRDLAESLAVPIIGIGCGENTCDGEVAVVTDLLGSYPWFVPPFARPEADVAAATREAVNRYIARVTDSID